jgi:hypothetical protein
MVRGRDMKNMEVINEIDILLNNYCEDCSKPFEKRKRENSCT